MINAVDGFLTAKGESWRSVTIPYRGDGLAMTIILPDEGAYDAVLGALTPALLAKAQQGTNQLLSLTIPAFQIDGAGPLTEALMDLGITEIFGSADLSGMVEGHELRADQVVHRAVISVDEKGTEAAAVTLMGVAESAAAEPVETFSIDRSFLFTIHDTVTGAPLFLGSVVDPS